MNVLSLKVLNFYHVKLLKYSRNLNTPSCIWNSRAFPECCDLLAIFLKQCPNGDGFAPHGPFGGFWRHFWLSKMRGQVCFWRLLGRNQEFR